MTGGEAPLPAAVAATFGPELRARLVELRRAIHADPELSLQEHRTAERLEAAFRGVDGVTVERVAGTGVVARVAGTDRSAPPVAIRGDIDALPIDEATGLAYASRNPGVMHACGHDVHATWAVGAGLLLSASPAHCDVLIVLQPGEETGRGALGIIESGALKECRAIVGAHVDRRFPVGQVVADDGPLAASADTFEIRVIGRGAHAARPHESRDPIVAGAAIVQGLQQIVARRLNPATPGVVTVGTFNAGTASNIIPERATLRGTVRAVDAASRRMLLDAVRQVAEGIAGAHDLAVEVAVDDGTPPVVNPPWPTRVAREAAAALVGAENVVPLGITNLAAEDFAHYLDAMPGCFLRIGAREPGGEFVAAHSPRFYPAEESIFVGAAVLAETARRIARG
jgi:hippurate hydrolase